MGTPLTACTKRKQGPNVPFLFCCSCLLLVGPQSPWEATTNRPVSESCLLPPSQAHLAWSLRGLSVCSMDQGHRGGGGQRKKGDIYKGVDGITRVLRRWSGQVPSGQPQSGAWAAPWEDWPHGGAGHQCVCTTVPCAIGRATPCCSLRRVLASWHNVARAPNPASGSSIPKFLDVWVYIYQSGNVQVLGTAPGFMPQLSTMSTYLICPSSGTRYGENSEPRWL